MRLDEFRVGAKFRDRDGNVWKLVRDHRQLAMLAVSEADGHEDWFAPCAEVEEVTQ